jgi:hypothetical protein
MMPANVWPSGRSASPSSPQFGRRFARTAGSGRSPPNGLTRASSRPREVTCSRYGPYSSRSCRRASAPAPRRRTRREHNRVLQHEPAGVEPKPADAPRAAAVHVGAAVGEQVERRGIGWIASQGGAVAAVEHRNRGAVAPNDGERRDRRKPPVAHRGARPEARCAGADCDSRQGRDDAGAASEHAYLARLSMRQVARWLTGTVWPTAGTEIVISAESVPSAVSTAPFRPNR